MENRVRAALEALRSRGYTVSFAESCTGGLIAKAFTDIAGCSDTVCGGVVSYSNHVKERVLGVGAGTLEKYGAVSEPVAAAMCEGVRRITDSDIAVSTTGIAGPGGAVPGKPVGTVCFGICKEDGVKTFTKHFDPAHTRDEIRREALGFALTLIIEACR